MDAAQRAMYQRAAQLVKAWVKDVQGLPITLSINRLTRAIARAFADLDREAYQRGYRDAADAALEDDHPWGEILIKLANAANAGGVWFIRGASAPYFSFMLPGDSQPTYLDLIPADLVVIARFPHDDQGQPGLEFHPSFEEGDFHGYPHRSHQT